MIGRVVVAVVSLITAIGVVALSEVSNRAICDACGREDYAEASVSYLTICLICAYAYIIYNVTIGKY